MIVHRVPPLKEGFLAKNRANFGCFLATYICPKLFLVFFHHKMRIIVDLLLSYYLMVKVFTVFLKIQFSITARVPRFVREKQLGCSANIGKRCAVDVTWYGSICTAKKYRWMSWEYAFVSFSCVPSKLTFTCCRVRYHLENVKIGIKNWF